MKRKLTLILAALFCCMPLSGCGNATSSDDAHLQVVCTIFPAYDWARQIIGETDDIDLTLLVNNGTDLHNYQPSVKDIATMKQADVLCYVGGTSDAWVSDALDSAELEHIQTIKLLDAADAREEVTVEGMQEEDGHEHEDANTDHNEIEIDEHVWLSLRQAQQICAAIRDTLCAADPDNSDAYTKNCETYVKQLQGLDEQYQKATTQDAVRDCILVADRFPFRYLAEDYDLTYYAAFPGCSAETEASFETIAFLAEKVSGLELPYILTTESSDQSIAKTVLENADSDAEILVLDSLQSITQNDLDNGVTYLSCMEDNLEVLQKALS